MSPSKASLSYPLCFIGIIMIICGIRWLINPEPWMLDEVANVERLGMTFEELFKADINATLPGYLTQIYRFFGFWVLIIGLLISSLSLSKAMDDNGIASRIIIIIGFMMTFGMYLGYTFIPNSHFIYLMWILFLFYCVSLYSFIRIRNKR